MVGGWSGKDEVRMDMEENEVSSVAVGKRKKKGGPISMRKEDGWSSMQK